MTTGILFEDLDALFFEDNNSVVVVTWYHWASADTDHYKYPLKKSDLSADLDFYICDNPYTWGDPHMASLNQQLYEVDCLIRKPLILMEQFLEFENMFRKPSPEHSLFIEGGFDSILYTPHQYGRGMRQGLIRDASQQVIAVREIEKPSAQAILEWKENEARFWTEILFRNRKQYDI